MDESDVNNAQFQKYTQRSGLPCESGPDNVVFINGSS